ncbi:sigma 54-interacting transcriptional regulator [Wukongibacter baidiensis]|uniref:sigma-54 interaction domain-containing protein n=1 Tax=Wukongibacter baidiensis TaxID=1723361 RepID=UPI003D7FE2FE
MSFPIELMDMLFDNMKQGIIVLNENFKVLFLNRFVDHVLDVKVYDDLNDTAPQFNPDSNSQKISYGDRILNIEWKKETLKQSKVYLGFISDITDHEHEKIRLSSLEAIVDNISEGIVCADTDGKIFIYNKASENLEGLSRKDVLGRKNTDVYRITDETSEFVKVLQTGKPLLGVYGNFLTHKGNYVDISCDYFPIFHNKGIVGVYALTRSTAKMQELLNRTIEIQEQLKSNITKILNPNCKYNFKDIIGTNKLFKQAVEEAKKAAKSDSSVLVVGETGTGKELFVQSIHEESFRRNEPFVPINCAAIPNALLESLLFGTVKGAFTGAVDSPGLFQQAAKGTLFLDELNSMSLNLQAKLLRVLEEKKLRKIGGKVEIPINCRIISATNQDPLECIKQNTLRKDLFYRLATITVAIPTLRNRKEDIEPLINHFIKKYNQKYNTYVTSISPNLIETFIKYDWPGNVRELEHLIESAIVMAENEKIISLEHLPSYFYKQFLNAKNPFPASLYQKSGSLSEVLQYAEEQTILQALSAYSGNVTKAADSLGIARQNLHYRIRKLGINTDSLKKR